MSLPGDSEDLSAGEYSGTFWGDEFWRREPRLFRSLLPSNLLASFDVGKVRSIVSALPHVRIFVSPAERAEAVQKSRFVPGSDAADLFGRLLQSEIKYTVLMNQVETVDEGAVSLRRSLGIPFHWRRDDIVLTFSSVGSGIGYHAGHEDAFIVQAAGERRWRIWSADETTSKARERILISAPGDIYPFVRSSSPPVIDCLLRPGDALYIPPFCPHEGITTVQSISIALGWRGISYFHVVSAFPELIKLPDSGRHPFSGLFFELLPDFDLRLGEKGRNAIVGRVLGRLVELGCNISDPDVLALRIQNMISVGELTVTNH